MTTAHLIDEHYGAMHRLARLVGREPEQAREAVRAAWLTALRDRDARPEGASTRGWLLVLVLLELAAPRPPQDHPPAAAEHEVEAPGTRWEGWWKDDLPPTPHPDDLALEAALMSIPAGLAAVLVLRDIEGLQPAEVARLLGHEPDFQLDLLQHGRAAVRNALRGGPVQAPA